jgi:RNA methyltransferase, TrmH family
MFIVEGERMLRRALVAGFAFQEVLVSEELLAAPTPFLTQLIDRVVIHGIPTRELEELSGGRASGSVMALLNMPASTVEGPAAQHRISELMTQCRVCLVAVDVEEPGNVGALLRSAHAAGAAFLAVGITDPFHPKAVRTSLGSLFRAPLARIRDSAEALTRLIGCGVTPYAAVASGGAAPWTLPLGRGPVAILVGSEARGLPDSLSRLTTSTTIPMGAFVDSFSVNAAAAILLYESLRAASYS